MDSLCKLNKVGFKLIYAVIYNVEREVRERRVVLILMVLPTFLAH